MKPKNYSFAARKHVIALVGTITVLFNLPTQAGIAERIKANNTTNLNLAASWDALTTSTDVGNWTTTVAAANTVALGADLSWQGIKIVAPGGLVTISPGNTLMIGGRGIDLSTATQDLTIQSGLMTRPGSGQIWNVATGRTLTLSTGIITRGAYSTVNVQGVGTVNSSVLTNDSTGLIGPWATYGTVTAAKYATMSAGSIIGYSGGTAAANAAAVTDTTGLVNYDVAAVGALGTGASFNTLRYTGAAGTITGNYVASGILNAGTGALILSGNVTISPKRELVIMNGDNNALRNITLSGNIGDDAGGPSAITKGGDGALILSGNNTYTGVTTVSRGQLQLSSNNGLGSPAAGTRLTGGIGTDNTNDGYLYVNNGVNSPEPIYFDSNTGSVLLGGTGTNTLSGPLRFNNGVRLGGPTSITFANGITTTGGAGGSQLLFNLNVTVSGRPIIDGSGALYMDQGQVRVIGVAGNLWGSTILGNGTLKTNMANALPATASCTIGGTGMWSPAICILDLNGFNQTIAGLTSGTNNFVTERSASSTVTSTTPALLTTNHNDARSLDAKFTGAVSLTKVGWGPLTLTAPSTTTGNFTADGGILTLNPQRALAAASGAGTVSNYLPTAAPMILGGGTFQLSGRTNGTSTTAVTGTWTGGANGTSIISAMSSTAGLAPGQTVTNANFPAGTYIVSVLTGLPGISGNSMIISAQPTASATGGTITPTTTNSWSTNQTFAGLTLNPGASGVAVNLNGGTESVLNLGTITLNGGTVNFTLPTGTQSATNGITLSNTNNNSILGGWARVGNDWAINSTNAVGGNVAALATYVDLTRLSSGTKTLTSDTTSNVRIIEGTGTAASITPASAGTTDINSLVVSGTTTAATTYDPGTTDILRLGAAGGIMVASNAFALNLGTAANDGKLTAGGAADTAGTIYLTSNNTVSANQVTINSTIVDNGAGVVGVTVSGAGVTKLTGTNTYTGKTVVGGTGVFNSTDRLEIASDANLGTAPASYVADQLTLAGGTLKSTAPVTLPANRGITVTDANNCFDTASTLTINGIIAGSGTITKPGQSGPGALVLNAANTFSGVMVNYSTGYNPSQLQLGNVNALQNATLDVSSVNNQSVVFTASGTNTYNLGGLMGGDELSLGANSISVGANNVTTTYYGTYTGTVTTSNPNGGGITGTGGLIKVGTGTLQLSGANNFSGDTLVSGGMLVLAHANALQNSTLDTGSIGTQSVNLNLAEGTVYNIGGLKGSADLDLAVCNLSVGANNSTTTFLGAIEGAFANSLFKVGTGTLTLAGANTYSGTTTVSNGTLELSGSNVFANDVTVITPGTFSLTNTGSLKFIVSDTTNNRVTGTGTASLNGAISISFSAVTTTTGSWPLVNATSKTFGSSFNVVGFTPNVDGVTWTKTEGTKLWTFSETSGVLTLAVAPINTFSNWVSTNYPSLSGADALIGADPDHDGLTNLVEYALNTNPTTSSQPPGVRAGSTLTFTKGSMAKADSNIVYSIEESTDLVTWTTPTGISPSGTVANGADAITYTFPSAPTKIFARLKVIQNP